ncbi:nuclear pore complex assembly-domain-containing protein [Polychytrium aggregatum]|uniref:nuclear pore complex assembly-domain-containing protein n=1 Tax=Polychytrium aggregatum TaxID=110093 RepID=UPI0022FEB764|nr:nuclear pore complex assembly-domain-containing protein [Polychytrium aggregatum]KAI9207086.1 nuclear pore complex assembly-domain-containing protein [Polychytrium aggregatum]
MSKLAVDSGDVFLRAFDAASPINYRDNIIARFARSPIRHERPASGDHDRDERFSSMYHSPIWLYRYTDDLLEVRAIRHCEKRALALFNLKHIGQVVQLPQSEQDQLKIYFAIHVEVAETSYILAVLAPKTSHLDCHIVLLDPRTLGCTSLGSYPISVADCDFNIVSADRSSPAAPNGCLIVWSKHGDITTFILPTDAAPGSMPFSAFNYEMQDITSMAGQVIENQLYLFAGHVDGLITTLINNSLASLENSDFSSTDGPRGRHQVNQLVSHYCSRRRYCLLAVMSNDTLDGRAHISVYKYSTSNRVFSSYGDSKINGWIDALTLSSDQSERLRVYYAASKGAPGVASWDDRSGEGLQFVGSFDPQNRDSHTTKTLPKRDKVLDLSPINNSSECTVLTCNGIIKFSTFDSKNTIPSTHLIPKFETWFSSSLSIEPLESEVDEHRARNGVLFIEKLLAIHNIDLDQINYPAKDRQQLHDLFTAIVGTGFDQVLGAHASAAAANDTADSYDDTVQRDCLIYYLLKDHCQGRGLSKDKEFAEVFLLPQHFQRCIDGFWYLDRCEYELAVNQLVHPSLNVEWSNEILEILYRNAPELAFQFLQGVRPPIVDERDLDIQMPIYLDHSLSQAFEFQRQYQAMTSELRLFKRLLEFVFDPKLPTKAQALRELLKLPLSESEEALLVDFCHASDVPLTKDFIIMYFVDRGRYPEAIAFNASLGVSVATVGAYSSDPAIQQSIKRRDNLISQLERLLVPVHKRGLKLEVSPVVAPNFNCRVPLSTILMPSSPIRTADASVSVKAASPAAADMAAEPPSNKAEDILLMALMAAPPTDVLRDSLLFGASSDTAAPASSSPTAFQTDASADEMLVDDAEPGTPITRLISEAPSTPKPATPKQPTPKPATPTFATPKPTAALETAASRSSPAPSLSPAAAKPASPFTTPLRTPKKDWRERIIESSSFGALPKFIPLQAGSPLGHSEGFGGEYAREVPGDHPGPRTPTQPDYDRRGSLTPKARPADVSQVQFGTPERSQQRAGVAKESTIVSPVLKSPVVVSQDKRELPTLVSRSPFSPRKEAGSAPPAMEIRTVPRRKTGARSALSKVQAEAVETVRHSPRLRQRTMQNPKVAAQTTDMDIDMEEHQARAPPTQTAGFGDELASQTGHGRLRQHARRTTGPFGLLDDDDNDEAIDTAQAEAEPEPEMATATPLRRARARKPEPSKINAEAETSSAAGQRQLRGRGSAEGTPSGRSLRSTTTRAKPVPIERPETPSTPRLRKTRGATATTVFEQLGRPSRQEHLPLKLREHNRDGRQSANNR